MPLLYYWLIAVSNIGCICPTRGKSAVVNTLADRPDVVSGTEMRLRNCFIGVLGII